MGVFDDKKFENLDWMTQITETIESELNVVLAKLPDRVEIDKKALEDYIHDGYGMSFNTRAVIRTFLGPLRAEYKMSWEDEQRLTGCFKLEAKGDLIIDYEKNTFEGELALVKVVHQFEDAELQKRLGQKGIDNLRNLNLGDAHITRMNEVLDILGGCDKDLKNRSARKKLQATCRRLRQIFEENEWRIRDEVLADKVSYWIKDYIRNGNLAALTNFCKLKVMTHNNMPIYSIEEET